MCFFAWWPCHTHTLSVSQIEEGFSFQPQNVGGPCDCDCFEQWHMAGVMLCWSQEEPSTFWQPSHLPPGGQMPRKEHHCPETHHAMRKSFLTKRFWGTRCCTERGRSRRNKTPDTWLKKSPKVDCPAPLATTWRRNKLPSRALSKFLTHPIRKKAEWLFQAPWFSDSLPYIIVCGLQSGALI